MNFISSENQLDLKDNIVIYFYSSNIGFTIHKLLLDTILTIEDKFKLEILCADVYSFKNFVKRFDLIELPTILFLKNGVEMKRITGIPAINNLHNIFAEP